MPFGRRTFPRPKSDRRRWSEQPMPIVAADIVDAYVFRKVNARVQFLLLLRRPGVVLGNTWQSIHAKITSDESALQAAERTILADTGLTTVDAFSADYINQFYDHT